MIVCRCLLLAGAALALRAAAAPVHVEPAEMQRVYDAVKTPFKYGVVLRGRAEELIDCPNVFRHAGRWQMIYIAFDGRGYETRLAVSDDLRDWRPLGVILPRAESGWDAEQTAGGYALIDHRWDGTWELQRHEGVVYHFYCAVGSEGRVIALATSRDLPTPRAP